MYLDPAIVYVVGITFALLLGGILLDRFKQPMIVAYLVVGIVLGPGFTGFLDDAKFLTPLGAVGLILFMFFVGMQVQPFRLLSAWRIALAGTLLQILFSIGCVWILGGLLGWPPARILLIAFVISNSSSPVVVRMLQRRGHFESDLGQNVLGITLVQDLAVIPMLMALALFAGEAPSAVTMSKQVLGALMLASAMYVAIRRYGSLQIPVLQFAARNEELQVFAAFAICFGFAFVSGFCELSTTFGAFAAGIVVAATRETRWFFESLRPFHILLVAAFFLSIGSMVDTGFVLDHLGTVALLVLLVLFTITLVNTFVLRLLGQKWRDAMTAASYLAQVGDFSFVLAAIGYAMGIVNAAGYQLAVATIAGSLLLSPAWVRLIERVTRMKAESAAAS